jgi:MFS family permease
MNQDRKLWKEFILSLTAIFFMATGTGAYLLLMVLYLEHLGLSASTIGIIKSLLSITEGIIVIFIVFFFRGKHTRLILVIAVLLLLLGILGYSTQPQSWLIWIATVISACGLGFLLVILFALPMQKRPSQIHMGFAVGLYTALIAAGNAVGSYIGGWSADYIGFNWAFLIADGFIFIVLLCVLFMSDVKRVEPIPVTTDQNQTAHPFVPGVCKPIWRIGVVAAFTLASISVVYDTLFPILALRELSLTTTYIGILAAIELVLAAVIRPFMGMALKKLKSRHVTISGLMCQTIFLCLIPLIGATWLLPVMTGLMGISFGIGRVASETLCMEDVVEAQMISKRLSSYRLAMIIGQTLTPLVSGWAADQWGLVSTIIFLPYGILLIFFITIRIINSKPFHLGEKNKAGHYGI